MKLNFVFSKVLKPFTKQNWNAVIQAASTIRWAGVFPRDLRNVSNNHNIPRNKWFYISCDSNEKLHTLGYLYENCGQMALIALRADDSNQKQLVKVSLDVEFDFLPEHFEETITVEDGRPFIKLDSLLLSEQLMFDSSIPLTNVFEVGTKYTNHGENDKQDIKEYISRLISNFSTREHIPDQKATDSTKGNMFFSAMLSVIVKYIDAFGFAPSPLSLASILYRSTLFNWDLITKELDDLTVAEVSKLAELLNLSEEKLSQIIEFLDIIREEIKAFIRSANKKL